MTIHIDLRRPDELDPGERSELLEFAGIGIRCTENEFEAVLAQTTYVWRGWKGDMLVACTAIRVLALPDHRATVIFTRLVVVAHAVRREGIIERMGAWSWIRARLRHPLHTLYWQHQAISPSGYLKMARNLPICWPRPGESMPARVRAIVDVLLAAQGGRVDWVDDIGIFATRLELPDASMAPENWAAGDPSIDFFLARNPNYMKGATLSCIAPLTLWNFVHFAFRLVRRRFEKRRGTGVPSRARSEPGSVSDGVEYAHFEKTSPTRREGGSSALVRL